ncbi:MAG: M15 family metallopeptidase [Lagierella massiliensis]|nr:M15 family metallopeptidase [Lagierella massiliensis]
MSKRERKSFKDINEKYSFLDQGVEGLKDRNVSRDEKSRQRYQERKSVNQSRGRESSRRQSENFRDHTIKMNPEAIEKERKRLQYIAMQERNKKRQKSRMMAIGLSIVAIVVVAFAIKALLDSKDKENIASTDPTNIIETINSDETTTLKGFVLVNKSSKYYQESNTSSTELGEIAAGEYLENYGVINGFNKIKYNGVDGYIETSNLSSINNENQFKVIKGLLVVNNQYGLPEDFQPGMNVQAKTNFDIMARKAKNDGVVIKIASDFRSYEQQKTNGYTDGVSAFGEYMADGSEVELGQSEHQTGLAFDVVGEDYENKYSENFEDSKEYKWLLENAHKYGFIIRYPKDKEDITGRKFEPWHIRFVEPTVADEMNKNNFTLEEYLGLANVTNKDLDNTSESENVEDDNLEDQNQDGNKEDGEKDNTNQDDPQLEDENNSNDENNGNEN